MLRGIDISMWQGIGEGDQAKDFVIVKATEGNGYTDPSCDAHYQRAKSQGKLLGVYHFARPDLGNTGRAEADWFVSQIEGYIGEAILVLDWEVNTWMTGWAKEFMDRVYELTGVKPMIYMSASPCNSYDWSAVADADYGLWIAGYPAQYNVPNPPEPAEGEMPFGTGAWSTWAIWQYSSSCGTMDRDVANMDREGWMAYASKSGEKPQPAPSPAPAPAPQPIPQPTPTKCVVYTVVPGDNLSSIAARFGTTYQKIAADNGIANPNLIYPGQVLKIYGVSGSDTPAPSTGINVGDRVVPITFVDYNGTPLYQTRDYYFVNSISGDRVVLAADSPNGAIYAAVSKSNLRKV